MNILVAEDDPVSQRILRLTLEKQGHKLFMADDGEKAWESLMTNPVEVVISDWMMPNVNGLELCRKVRARRKREYVYFILVTTLSSQENFMEAMDAGVDDFLNKPLRPDALLTRLRVASRILQFIGQIRELKKLLPICMYCKNIRDDKSYWHQIESYIHERTGTDFSHSICPDCYEKCVKPQLEAIGPAEKPKPA